MKGVKRQLSRRLVVRVGVSSTVTACLVTGSLWTLAGQSEASDSQHGGPAQLALQYLDALKPVNATIAQVESALKKLPASATAGRVESVVAPLQGKLAPLEGLLTSGQSQSPTHPGGLTLLTSLGLPVVMEFYDGPGPSTANKPAPWGTWGSSTAVPCLGAKDTSAMSMAGTRYAGMQLVGPTCAAGSVLYEASWHFGTAQRFTVDVGLDSAGARPSVALGFVNVVGTLAHPTAWRPLNFTADGTPASAGATLVTTGVPTTVSVNLSGVHELTALFLVDGPSPMIDLANGEFQN